jgi:transposase-like protein
MRLVRTTASAHDRERARPRARTTASAHERGRSLEALRAGVRQADLDAGERHAGLTSEELTERRRLRREKTVVREEREIGGQAAAVFARETTALPGGRARSSSA